MCRLFACAGQLSVRTVITALKEFRRVAKVGAVPPVPNIKRGHTEGWGMVAYSRGAIVYEKRRKAFAFRDPEFLHSIPHLAVRKPDIVVAHVRKMTYGMVASRNNHPFVFGSYSFAHNGSIDGTEKLPLKSYFKDSIKGTTDTERVFAYFLQMLYAQKRRTASTVHTVFKRLIHIIRARCDYVAMNFVFASDTHLWAMRDYNPSNSFVKKYDLTSSFELFIGRNQNGTLFVCSERMNLPRVTWRALENREGIEYAVRTRIIREFSL